MAYIIDRRLHGKDKSAINRQRFIKRHRKHIRDAVSEAINKRSIRDLDRGEEITIPKKDISEPALTHAPGGIQQRVLPGNRDYNTGDRIPRPPAGGGQGNRASDSGEGEDEFIFQISQSEFLEFMFEDLALPNLEKRNLSQSENFKSVKAGISDDGNPNQINIIRSLRSAHGRRLAITGARTQKINALNEELKAFKEPLTEDETVRRNTILEELAHLQRGSGAVPFLDDFDLKFNLRAKRPQPITKAVMFCVMDVSGSMDQETKDIAKRFFILLYLFLQRNYEKTDIVFIRHHSSATEVDEQEFFYSRETGGTVVSSALNLMAEIIEKRYPVADWNIYGAQASDGDNWQNDSPTCQQLLRDVLLPKSQYYSYIEITDRGPQELWEHYASIQSQFPESFSMRNITSAQDIFPVFRELFQSSPK